MEHAYRYIGIPANDAGVTFEFDQNRGNISLSLHITIMMISLYHYLFIILGTLQLHSNVTIGINIYENLEYSVAYMLLKDKSVFFNRF
jgi:hypothetical protein